MAGQRSGPPAPPERASAGATGVYGITTAAPLTGMSVQVLRLYERTDPLDLAHTTMTGRRLVL